MEDGGQRDRREGHHVGERRLPLPHRQRRQDDGLARPVLQLAAAPGAPRPGYPTKCTDEVFTCVGAICYTKHQAHDHLTTCSTFHGAADLTLDECKNAAATLGLPVAADSWQGDEGWTNLPKGCVGNLGVTAASQRPWVYYNLPGPEVHADITAGRHLFCKKPPQMRCDEEFDAATNEPRGYVLEKPYGYRASYPQGAATWLKLQEMDGGSGGRWTPHTEVRVERGSHWRWSAAGQSCDQACAGTGACNAEPLSQVDNLATFQELMADGLNAPTSSIKITITGGNNEPDYLPFYAENHPTKAFLSKGGSTCSAKGDGNRHRLCYCGTAVPPEASDSSFQWFLDGGKLKHWEEGVAQPGVGRRQAVELGGGVALLCDRG